ncbi:MAG: hypothetical protein KKF93_02500, partial [Candidatus Omnitrophica bacterium]|nr:hypothetical protein [Candidatus Omnitrophota bacterium]
MESLETKKQFITLAQAAKRTGYTPEYLNSLARQGILLAQKIGRNWFVAEQHLQSFEAWIHSSSYPKPGRKKNHAENPIQLATPVQAEPVKLVESAELAETVETIPAVQPEQTVSEESMEIISATVQPFQSRVLAEKFKLPIFKERLLRWALTLIFFWGTVSVCTYLLAYNQTEVAVSKPSAANSVLAETPIFDPQTFPINYQEKLGKVLTALALPPDNFSLHPHTNELASETPEPLPFGVGVKLNPQYFPDNESVAQLFDQNNFPQSSEPKIAGAEKSTTLQSKINIPPLSKETWKYIFLIGSALIAAALIFWFFYSIHHIFLQPVGMLGWAGLIIFSLISSLTLNQFISQNLELEPSEMKLNPFVTDARKGVQISGKKETQEALVTAGELNAELFSYVLKDSLKKGQTLAGDVYLNWEEKLKLAEDSVKSREIARHAIEAEDIDTGSITSRTIRDYTIQGKDIDPETDITVNDILSQQIIAETLIINQEATIPVLNITDLIDFGTNTIADGNFVGDWNFNGGDFTNVGTIASGAITATGHILPGVDSLYNLGALGNEWANLYVDNITAGTISMSGNLDMQNNLILNIGNAGTDFTAAGGLVLADNLTVTTGGIAIYGASTITGTLTVTDNLDAQNGLDITGNNLTVGGANFIVDVTNGNITTVGDIDALTGTITTLDGVTLNYTTGNITTGNITTANVTTLDLGTNVITDGNLNGDWDFNAGTLTDINALTATTGNITTANVTTLDLGTNVITDGNLNGDWDFNAGTLTDINALTATTGNITTANVT